MITIQQFMETINYRIGEGDDYGWKCYGPNSYQIGAWNGVHGAGGWSANIVFSTKSQKVYEVEVCDYTHNRAYRLINPKFVEKHRKETEERGQGDFAWDDVKPIDLDVDSDWLEKAQAIVSGQEYDTRVSMAVDLPDDELFQYMKLAHEQDITLNQFIERALQEAMDRHREDLAMSTEGLFK
jgi:hypothetical protein